jgi:Tol biopolymer transport system component
MPAPTGPLAVSNQFWEVRLSPDANRIAYTLVDTTTGNLDIWIFDPAKGTTRLTHNQARDRLPVWSPDGKEIVFCSDRQKEDIFDLYRIPVRTGGEAKLLLSSGEYKQPFDWSQDGKYIAFVKSVQTKEMRSDIWILPMKSGEKPFAFVQTKANEWDPHFSPDGKWIAYCSNETGPNEVYVAPFPGPGEKVHITASGRTAPVGGSCPRWARGGKEIFYLGPDNMLWIAELKITQGEVEISSTRRAFQTYAAPYAGSYDVSRDGTRIIINSDWQSWNVPPVILVANWSEMLREE